MSHRPQQVAKEIWRAASAAIDSEIDVERFGMVTITDVVVTPGLERATIFVRPAQGGEAVETYLNKKARRIKQQIRHSIELRRLPELVFRYDISAEQAERIEKLLDENEEK